MQKHFPLSFTSCGGGEREENRESASLIRRWKSSKEILSATESWTQLTFVVSCKFNSTWLCVNFGRKKWDLHSVFIIAIIFHLNWIGWKTFSIKNISRRKKYRMSGLTEIYQIFFNCWSHGTARTARKDVKLSQTESIERTIFE